MVWVEASKPKSAIRALHRPGNEPVGERGLPGAAVASLNSASARPAGREAGGFSRAGRVLGVLVATAGMILSLDLTGMHVAPP